MKRFFYFVSLPAIAAVVLSACGEKPTALPESVSRIPPVSFEIRLETSAKEYFFDGVIEAASQSTVSAQTGGRVAELPYDVGDYVPKDA